MTLSLEAQVAVAIASAIQGERDRVADWMEGQATALSRAGEAGLAIRVQAMAQTVRMGLAGDDVDPCNDEGE
jgi:hypothetical protein